MGLESVRSNTPSSVSLPATNTAATDELDGAQLATLTTALGGLTLQRADGTTNPEQVKIAQYLLIQNKILPPLKAGEDYTTDLSKLKGDIAKFQGSVNVPTDSQLGPQTWTALFGGRGSQLTKLYDAPDILGKSSTPMTLADAQKLYGQLHNIPTAGTPAPAVTTGFDPKGPPPPPLGASGSPNAVAGVTTYSAKDLQNGTTVPMVLSSELMDRATKELGADAAKALNEAVAKDPEARKNFMAWIDKGTPREITLQSAPIEGAAVAAGPKGSLLQIGPQAKAADISAALKGLGSPTAPAPKAVQLTYYPALRDASRKLRPEVVDGLASKWTSQQREWAVPLIKDAIAKDPATGEALASLLSSTSKGFNLQASGHTGAGATKVVQASDGSVSLTLNASAKAEDFSTSIKGLSALEVTALPPGAVGVASLKSGPANSAGKIDEGFLEKALGPADGVKGANPGDRAWMKKLIVGATRDDKSGDINKIALDWAVSPRVITFASSTLPGVTLNKATDGSVKVLMGTGATSADVSSALKALGASTEPWPKKETQTVFTKPTGADGRISGDNLQALTASLPESVRPKAYAALYSATRADKGLDSLVTDLITNTTHPFQLVMGQKTQWVQDKQNGNVTLVLAANASPKDVLKAYQALPS